MTRTVDDEARRACQRCAGRCSGARNGPGASIRKGSHFAYGTALLNALIMSKIIMK